MTTQPKIALRKRIIFSTVAVFFVLLVIGVIGEIFFRLFPQFVADPAPPPPHDYRALHETVGWVVKADYQYDGQMRDAKGTPYPLHVTFGHDGFRKWGDPASTRKKILFIGDSYTAAVQTSDEQLFYKMLGDSLHAEVFAYGAAGFSTTQEDLIMEKYLPEIKPDLIVWQTCCNDFLDNYWELEKQANYHVRMRRPYTMEDGSTSYHWANEYPRSVKRYSYFLYYLLKRIGQATGSFDAPRAESAEKFLAEQDLAYAPFARSVRMTDAAFKRGKALIAPSTKLIVFDADDYQPQYNHLARICRENNQFFADGVNAFVHQAEANGECVRADDGYHWNNRGHSLVAQFLLPVLRRQLN